MSINDFFIAFVTRDEQANVANHLDEETSEKQFFTSFSISSYSFQASKLKRKIQIVPNF
jgi:enoyl-[acyl-carrier-protein] reductase (NADH)